MNRERINPVIIFAIMLAIMPYAFVWTAEVSQIYSMKNMLDLTNGFTIVTGSQAYHFTMYVLFGMNILAAYLLIRREGYSV